jgi:predicted  nucleic acid-binding Zn-ribbon protein
MENAENQKRTITETLDAKKIEEAKKNRALNNTTDQAEFLRIDGEIQVIVDEINGLKNDLSNL